MIYKATTPTYLLTFNGVDFNDANEIVVTITDGNRTVLLELEPEHTENTLSFELTQAQTLAMPAAPCLLQVNWTYGDGKRACSNIARIDFKANLKNEVME